MLATPINELRVELGLVAESPVIVKEGRYTDVKKREWSNDRKDIKLGMPDVIPVSRAPVEDVKKAVLSPQSWEAVDRLPMYLPGTSLKGAWRSYLERLLRSNEKPEQGNKVCDPLEDDPALEWASCCKVLTDRKTRDKGEIAAYRLSCPICRMFGNTVLASRVEISDGSRDERQRGGIVQREHVAIDRRTGRVGGPPLRFYGLEGTRFLVNVRLRNFELWQGMMLGVLLESLGARNIPVGMGKSKGYGRVRGEVTSVRLSYFGMDEPGHSRLQGIGEAAGEQRGEWLRRYGIEAGVGVELAAGAWKQVEMWRWERELGWEGFKKAWQEVRLPWSKFGALRDRATAGV